MEKKNIWIISLVTILIIGFLIYPSNKTAEVNPTGPVKEFKIISSTFEFSPSTITVNKGDLVRIIASSADVPHGLSIPEFGVNLYLDGPEEISIEFVADKAGTFPFACSVYCGDGHGQMKGQLIVK